MEETWELAVVSEDVGKDNVETNPEKEEVFESISAEEFAKYLSSRERKRQLHGLRGFVSIGAGLLLSGFFLLLLGDNDAQKIILEDLYHPDGTLDKITVAGFLVVLAGTGVLILGLFKLTNFAASSSREQDASLARMSILESAGISTLTNEELAQFPTISEEEWRESDKRSTTLVNIRNLLDDNETITASWSRVFMSSRMRLQEHGEGLAARSRFNLGAGVGFAVATIVTILLVIFFREPIVTKITWSQYVHRVGLHYFLIILLQLLTFFFLRNFLRVETAIKENKNEVTNLELKLASGLMLDGTPQSQEALALIFAKDDRNSLNPSQSLDLKSTSSQLEELRKIISTLGKATNK